jgi:hypothetical protein
VFTTTDHIYLDIKAVDIKHLNAPIYKGLSIDALLTEGAKDDRVKNFLPETRDISRLPRQFIVNVLYTVVG